MMNKSSILKLHYTMLFHILKESCMCVYIHALYTSFYMLFNVVFYRHLNENAKSELLSAQSKSNEDPITFSCKGMCRRIFHAILNYSLRVNIFGYVIQGPWCIIIFRTLQFTAICIRHMSRVMRWTFAHKYLCTYLCMYIHIILKSQ